MSLVRFLDTSELEFGHFWGRFLTLHYELNRGQVTE